MQGTDWDCPRCSSEIKKIDEWYGHRLQCRECGYRLEGVFSKFYLKISSFLHERVSV